MFTPMQHINANRSLKRICTIISDGRYSGVTYGAAIGHMTPEAMTGGGIGYLKTGDILHLQLRNKRIDLVESFTPKIQYASDIIGNNEQQALFTSRYEKMKSRQRLVAAVNRMVGHTDAAKGVVPAQVYDDATEPFKIDQVGKLVY